MEESKEIFGFIIEPDIILDIGNNRLIKVGSVNAIKFFSCTVIPLKKNTTTLFAFLLTNARGVPLSRQEILMGLFKLDIDTSLSLQRLWQIMQDLKLCLEIIGAPEQLIVEYPRRGICVEYDYIRVLYAESTPSI